MEPREKRVVSELTRNLVQAQPQICMGRHSQTSVFGWMAAQAIAYTDPSRCPPYRETSLFSQLRKPGQNRAPIKPGTYDTCLSLCWSL